MGWGSTNSATCFPMRLNWITVQTKKVKAHLQRS